MCLRRRANISTSCGALEGDLAEMSVDEFYRLARALLIKDERNLDKFDIVFAATFKGVLSVAAAVEARTLPEEWLRRMIERYLSPEERAQIEKLGFDRLMETLRQRLAEQKGAIRAARNGSARAEPRRSAAMATIPRACASARTKGRRGSAVKVWDKREFRDFDGDAELGPRNIKLALRRLRRFAREGAADELDLDGTIRSTADKGYIDVLLRPERRNAVKVLLFLDVGGSMDWHVEAAEQLFSAARSQFKRLDHFYFHNCLYESVWKNNRRRNDERVPTLDLINSYRRDYRVVFVGDASMSPHEIMAPGGSVEHFNPEPGKVWLERAIRRLAARRVDQSDAAEALEPFAVDDDDRRNLSAPHVCADPRRRGGGDAGADRLTLELSVRAASFPDHQHRTLRVAHDGLGVRAEQIVRHDWTMGAHDDEVGVPFGGFLQELVIDSASAGRGAFALRRQIDAGENRVERVFRPLRLLDVEIDRHVFHEGRRHDRLHIDQPQFAAARRRRAPSPARAPLDLRSARRDRPRERFACT